MQEIITAALQSEDIQACVTFLGRILLHSPNKLQFISPSMSRHQVLDTEMLGWEKGRSFLL